MIRDRIETTYVVHKNLSLKVKFLTLSWLLVTSAVKKNNSSSSLKKLISLLICVRYFCSLTLCPLPLLSQHSSHCLSCPLSHFILILFAVLLPVYRFTLERDPIRPGSQGGHRNQIAPIPCSPRTSSNIHLPRVDRTH